MGGALGRFVYQWDLVTGEGINFMPMTRPVLCIAAWEERNLLIAGDENGRMVYWDCYTGKTPLMQKEIYSAQQKDSQGRAMIAPTHSLVVERFVRNPGIAVQEIHAGWLFAAVGDD